MTSSKQHLYKRQNLCQLYVSANMVSRAPCTGHSHSCFALSISNQHFMLLALQNPLLMRWIAHRLLPCTDVIGSNLISLGAVFS